MNPYSKTKECGFSVYLMVFSWVLSPRSFFLPLLGSSYFHSLLQFQFPLDIFLKNILLVLSSKLSTS
jgi:hypothetical protein